MSWCDVPREDIKVKVRPIRIDGKWKTLVKVYTKEEGFVTQGKIRTMTFNSNSFVKYLDFVADGVQWVALAPLRDFWTWLKWARRNTSETFEL